MLTGNIKNILKKRLWISFLDFYGFFLLSILLLSFLIQVKLKDYGIFSFFIGFIIYYGFFPKITKGYTLFGYLFKMRIISLDGKKISFIQYLKRAIYAIFSPFRFLFYTKVKFNKKGQFYYDKIFDTTVAKSIAVFEKNDEDEKYYDYFFLAENIKYLFYFIFTIFGLSVIKYILNF